MEHNISLPDEFMIIKFFQKKEFYKLLFNGQTYEIIGKDDVGNFIGVALDNRVFYLDTSYNKYEYNLIYISKNTEAFAKQINVYNQYNSIPFPYNPVESELKEREYNFKELIREIDKNAFCNDETFWSVIAEEMEYGII